MTQHENNAIPSWYIFRGNEHAPHDLQHWPRPPTWRRRQRADTDTPPLAEELELDIRGATFEATPEMIERVNLGIYLRRPLFVVGPPGSGKTSLAYAIAHELKLGPVLTWPINTRSTLKEGLYHYDAIARLQDIQIEKLRQDVQQGRSGQSSVSATIDIGRYIRLGPLGTAMLPRNKPRVLLIDEIDKSDIDLPNDLLNIFEEGSFDIPELTRSAEIPSEVKVMPHDGRGERDRVAIVRGRVRCDEFPIVIMTSNEERAMPAAFMRRCIKLVMKQPDAEQLARIVRRHFPEVQDTASKLIEEFTRQRENGRQLATDQLLNLIHMVLGSGLSLSEAEVERLQQALLQPLLD